MSTIRRKILRDVISRKTRTALVSLSVFIGVLGVVVLTTLGQLVTRQLEKDLVPAEMAMLRIYLDIPSGETLDNAAYLEFLREQPGVTAVEGQFAYQFQWKRPGQSEFQTGQLYAYSAPFGQIKLEPPRLVAGRYPTAGGGEVAVERRMAEKQRLKIGDTLVVQTRTLQEEPFRIVGIVFQPYLYFGSDDATTSLYAAAPDAQHILGFSGFSSIYVGFKSFPTARQELHAFRAALTKQTPYKINFYLVNDPQQNAFIVGVRQFSRVLRILAIVAIIVANFLVANVISTIVAEQRQQIGAMKALGATRLNILCLYLLMALVYGLIGTVPALLLGVPLGRYIAQQAAPLANTILENTTPPPLALLLGAALGLGTPMLAAIIPVYHGSRITILEAMTDQGITATYGKGLLPRLLNRLHLPMEIHQALNHTLHRKARLALTILSLSLAAAAFMGVFAVFHTLTSVVRDLRDQLDYDVSTDPSQLAVRDLMQAILTDEPVREIQRGVAVELHVSDPETGGAVRDPSIPYETDPVYVTGIDTQKDLGDLVMVEGTGWADDPERRGIVITPGLAEQFGKTVGDTLHLQAPDRAEDFEIIGLADYPFQTAFMEWHQLAGFVGIIRDAPIPNAYWEQVQVQTQEGGSPLKDRLVWAIGIDERVGKFLVPSFDPSTPGVIISQELAAEGGFEKGQPLALRPANLSLLESITDRTPVTYPITGIVGLTPQETDLLLRSAPPTLLAEDHPLIIALYWPELASLVQLDYRTITPGTFSIDLANPANNSLTSAKPVTIYSNQVAFADKIAETLLSLGLLMSFASLLMALVGSIGLLTITSIGVFERQREIGVMRSVGATSRAITRQFLLEGLLIGWIAWLAGVPLSYALSLVLIHSVPFNQVIRFSYTPFAAIIGLAGMLAVTAAATLYPSLMAARKTVSEILRYQ